MSSSWPIELTAAAIAAGVALITTILAQPLRFIADRALYRGQIRTQYRQDRLREINEVVGKHLGPMLEAAEAFDHRMRNMYQGPTNRSWLEAGGNYSSDSYYLDTTVQRFLALVGMVRRFEVRALHVDPRIVKRSDFAFVAYSKSLRWVMTNVALFGGLDYDDSRATDHFMTDRLRAIADEAITAGTGSVGDFKEHLREDSECWRVWRFFDGISPDEDRLRWDRLVCFHLVLMLFLRAYGYPMQRPTKDHFRDTMARLRHPEIALNLRSWGRRLGLSRSDVRLLRS